jgi:hypothetical protein
VAEDCAFLEADNEKHPSIFLHEDLISGQVAPTPPTPKPATLDLNLTPRGCIRAKPSIAGLTRSQSGFGSPRMLEQVNLLRLVEVP